MRRSRLVLIALMSGMVACGGGAGGGSSSGTPPTTPTPPPSTPTVTAADLNFCVAETNRLRATIGVPALTRVSELDTYAATPAAADGASCTPHGYALSTFLGNGVARAENELLCTSTSPSLQSIIAQGFAQMFAEGPGGGHYDNMAALYTATGCGAVVTSRGFTLVQAFR